MRHITPWLVMIAVFFALIGTSQMQPLVWDEGELISRALAVKQWGEQAVASPMGDKEHVSPFSREGIAASWKSTTTIEGHPGGYLAVIAFGRVLADLANDLTPDFVPKLSPKTSWRFGPILLMSLALGVMFSALRKHFGSAAALFSVMAVLLVPRVFAHAHLATCDGVLMAAWLLAVATFPMPQESVRRSRKRIVFSAVIWGLCLGLTLSAKFTGWAILGIGVWGWGIGIWKKMFTNKSPSLPPHDPHPTTLIPPSPTPSYVIGLCVALFVFYVLNPPLWHRPISGFADFVYLNTHRGGFNVSTLFWGQMYHLEKPLPWYNTLVWAAITFPILLFVMLPFGVHRMFPRTKRASVFPNDSTCESAAIAQANSRCFAWLIVLNAVVLLVVRAIPGTPPHDGVRLFVPAFPFLAIIAGIGMSVIWQLRFADVFRGRGKKQMRTLCPPNESQNKPPARSNRLACSDFLVGRLTVVLVLVVGTGNLVYYAPQWLSFYNVVIGGVAGASRKGFEPTYYWDAFDAEVIAVLNKNTGENEKIQLTPARSSKTFDLVRAWDGLQPEFRPNKPGEYRWYVFQMRPSLLLPVDKILLQNFEPAYVKTVSQPSLPFSQSQKTPILYVFEYDDYRQATEMLESMSSNQLNTERTRMAAGNSESVMNGVTGVRCISSL
jgi:4-amino-4-deoxy-L-arabinose transferase and related glycosyltransferases of PMT family